MSSTDPGARTESVPGRAGWVGAAAVTAGLGVGHLVAAVTVPEASPLVAVAARVIDAAPKALKDWAVTTLGNLDKPVLLLAVAVVALVLGVLVGRLAARRPRLGWLGVAALGVVVGGAALLGLTPSVRALFPALATTAIGALILRWLLPRARPEAVPDDPTAADLAQIEAGRRQLLLGVAGAISLGLLTGVAGSVVPPSKQYRVVTLPNPAHRLPPPQATLPVEGMAPYVTPQEELYRVDINVAVPTIDVADWRLDIDGLVDRPYSLTWDDLVALELIERDATLMCVSNLVGGSYIGHGRWLGVRTRDLLARAGVKPGADMVLSTSTDSFTVSTPLAALTDDRDALVAIGFNGELLRPEHGYPARLITPGLYGFVGATKWLRRLTVTRFADRQAYWTVRGWSDRAPLKLSSRIATPTSFRTIKPGAVAIGGTAWASRVVVATVEVRVDGGSWREATLGPDGGLDSWRQWSATWAATPGAHTLECRAWSSDGKVQSEGPLPPDPDGAEGYHLVKVQVAA